MNVYRRFAPMALVLALTACPAFDVVGPDPGVTLRFEVEPAGHGQWLESPEVAVQGMAAGVRIETLMSTPDPCQRFDATASRDGADLVLRVEVRRNAPGCIAVVGTFRYQAILSDLTRGAYRVTVIHTFPETGDPAPRTVFVGDVEVR